MDPITLQDATPLSGTSDLRPLAAVLNALSTTRRLGVVRKLLRGPATMGEINTAINGTATHEVDLLTKIGIVERIPVSDGRRHDVRLVDGALDDLVALLCTTTSYADEE